MPIGRFIAGIAALVRDPASGKYLVLRRSQEKDFGAGAWECVTGRVDQGEGFDEALHREVREELGAEITVDFIAGTTHFYRGAPVPENELVGVLYCCTLDDPTAIRVSSEHDERRWITPQEAQDLLPRDHWLGTLIRHAENIRNLATPDLLAYYREIFAA
jgi:8-oxo-dGTP pyrophosphatase MutT (NUDIX family)